MGLEIFDSNGHLVVLSNMDEQLEADPPDINVLPEYESDPRTVDKLLTDTTIPATTCTHGWPFRQGNDHCIFHLRYKGFIPRCGQIIINPGFTVIEVLDTLKSSSMEITYSKVKFRCLLALAWVQRLCRVYFVTTDENVLRIIERYDKIPRTHNLQPSAMMGNGSESQWRHGWGGVGPHSVERPERPGSGMIGNDEGISSRHNNHNSGDQSDTTGIGVTEGH